MLIHETAGTAEINQLVVNIHILYERLSMKIPAILPSFNTSLIRMEHYFWSELHQHR